MVAEELILLKEFGIGATAFILTFFLLRWTTQRAFTQSDKVLALAENTIKENTIALGKMYDGLTQHMRQKDEYIERMKECRKDRDEMLRALNDKS